MDAVDDPQILNAGANTHRWGGVNALAQMARRGLWTTPVAADAYRDAGSGYNKSLKREVEDFWPTPTVEGNANRSEYSPKAGDGLETAVNRQYPTPVAADSERVSETYPRGNPTLLGHLRNWPTPRARDGYEGNCVSEGRRNTPSLEWQVQNYPTPTAWDADGGGVLHPEKYRPGIQVPLSTMVAWMELADDADHSPGARFATPTVQDAKNNAARSQLRRKGPALNVQVGGKLNPAWVSWLMGVPVGWVSLDPMPWSEYRRWLNAGPGWWASEPDAPRTVEAHPGRVSQIRALGNGLVPAVVALWVRGMEQTEE